MRILHLVDLSDRASMPALACASAIARLEASHTVWTLGRVSSHSSPLSPSRRLPAPIGSTYLAARALRRAVRERAGAFDLITCWSAGALLAVHGAFKRPPMPIVSVFTTDFAVSQNAVVARLQRRSLGAGAIMSFSAESVRQLHLAGASDVRSAPPVIGFDTSALPSRERARAELCVEPEERVLALLADPPRIGDTRRFAYLAGLLSVGGAPMVALVHEDGGQIRRAARFVRDCGRAWRIVPCRGPLVNALPACDAALVDTQVIPPRPLLLPGPGSESRPSAPPLMAALATQLGVPVVTPRLPFADELRNAGVPVIAAADTSCLALAAALFPIIDAGDSTRTAASTPPAVDALDMLHELWLERLNAPLPGFPLSPSQPVPGAGRVSVQIARAGVFDPT